MVTITYQCSCGKSYDLDESKRGRKVKCPACGTTGIAGDPPKEPIIHQAATPTPEEPIADPPKQRKRTPVVVATLVTATITIVALIALTGSPTTSDTDTDTPSEPLAIATNPPVDVEKQTVVAADRFATPEQIERVLTIRPEFTFAVNDGKTLLGRTVGLADGGGHRVVAMLIWNGACTSRPGTAQWILENTQNTNVAKLAIQCGADVDGSDGDGGPLGVAMLTRHTAILELLLENGADASLYGDGTVTIADYANDNMFDAAIPILARYDVEGAVLRPDAAIRQHEVALLKGANVCGAYFSLSDIEKYQWNANSPGSLSFLGFQHRKQSASGFVTYDWRVELYNGDPRDTLSASVTVRYIDATGYTITTSLGNTRLDPTKGGYATGKTMLSQADAARIVAVAVTVEPF